MMRCEKTTWFAALPVALALVFGADSKPAYSACKNFVGGVCLDKKPAAKPKAKKSTTRKKSNTRRKAKPTVKADPVKLANPRDCMQMQMVNNGNSGNLSAVTFTNSCDAVVNVWININTCSTSVNVLGAKFKRQQKNAAIAVKGREQKSVAYRVTEDQKKQRSDVKAVYHYGDVSTLKDKSKYPKSKC